VWISSSDSQATFLEIDSAQQSFPQPVDLFRRPPVDDRRGNDGNRNGHHDEQADIRLPDHLRKVDHEPRDYPHENQQAVHRQQRKTRASTSDGRGWAVIWRTNDASP
jgi:hypothetical protein